MRRRKFIGTSALGAVAATRAAATPAAAIAKARAASSTATESALAALNAARRLEIKGDFAGLPSSYHSDAIVVEPSSLKPSIGRAAIKDTLAKKAKGQKLVYFYYRQPQVSVSGNSAFVVSNFESGYDTGDGKPIEYTGKSASVILLGAQPPLIAQEVLVPNIQAGGYGPLGRALGPTPFGIFPMRALGRDPIPAASAGGGEKDVLLAQVRKIHAAWVARDTSALLKYSSKDSVFLMGDYSPFYVSGVADLEQHFADFYKEGSVKYVRETEVTVGIWGDAAVVAFTFDLDYAINGASRRSPGRGVYAFERVAGTWGMRYCAATHLVARNIGDPYPVPGAST
jgi:ketosteroid isomerase-like protein